MRGRHMDVFMWRADRLLHTELHWLSPMCKWMWSRYCLPNALRTAGIYDREPDLGTGIRVRPQLVFQRHRYGWSSLREWSRPSRYARGNMSHMHGQRNRRSSRDDLSRW